MRVYIYKKGRGGPRLAKINQYALLIMVSKRPGRNSRGGKDDKKLRGNMYFTA